MSLFDHPGDGSEDEGTFFSLASEYLEAARVLHDTPPTRVGYWIVIYYLLGHSAELTLKSYLFDQGITPETLKNDCRHNLEKLIKIAKSHGLKKEISLSAISALSHIYKAKELEYRKNKRSTFPSEEDLIREIQELQNVVFERVIGKHMVQ